jgi:hypothetical protein
MAKQVWRRVAKYGLGAWVPASLVGIGYLLFFTLAAWGLLLVASKPTADPSIIESRTKLRACVANDISKCEQRPPVEQ